MRPSIALAALPMLVALGPAAHAGSTQVNWAGDRAIVRRSTGDLNRPYTYHESANGGRVVPTGRSGRGTTWAPAGRTSGDGSRAGSTGTAFGSSRSRRTLTQEQRAQRRVDRLAARRATTLAKRIETLRDRITAAGFDHIEVIGQARDSVVHATQPLRGGRVTWQVSVNARGSAARPPIDAQRAQQILDGYYQAQSSFQEIRTRPARALRPAGVPPRSNVGSIEYTLARDRIRAFERQLTANGISPDR
jgi:hypothetical protein